MTSWWTTTSWSWPDSYTWTPTCFTAPAGMCPYSVYTVNHICVCNEHKIKVRVLFPFDKSFSTLTETLRTMDLSLLQPFPPGQPKNFANFLDKAIGIQWNFNLNRTAYVLKLNSTISCWYMVYTLWLYSTQLFNMIYSIFIPSGYLLIIHSELRWHLVVFSGVTCWIAPNHSVHFKGGSFGPYCLYLK